MHKSKDRKQTTNKPNTYSISQMNQKISLTSPIPSVKPIQNLIPINSCPTSKLPVVIIMLSYLWSMLMHRFYPWLFLVPWIGGRWYRITQLAVYTTYIPLIYCLLGGYMIPTTFYGEPETTIDFTIRFFIWDRTSLHHGRGATDLHSIDESEVPWVVRQMYVYMGVSKNRGTPKSSILIGFSIINHPFWGTPIFGNPHINNRALVHNTATYMKTCYKAYLQPPLKKWIFWSH